MESLLNFASNPQQSLFWKLEKEKEKEIREREKQERSVSSCKLSNR
jgi:hypothetical protein